MRFRFLRLVLCSFFLLFIILHVSHAIAPTRGAEYLGEENGTRFRVYAPHASSVSVAGEWNEWSSTANPLQEGDYEVWYGQIPEADRYMKYKFVVDGHHWNKDPNSLMVEHSGWDSNSIIADFGHYQWSDNEQNWQSGAHVPAITEMVIYELHLKSFMFKNDDVPYQSGNFFNLFVEHKLDYLQDLGINAISLMPVHEFPGDQSWGYNPAFWFAVESAYGTPYDFQRFVDECHKRGIAVILDVCWNHAGPNDINHYWNFDGGYIHDIGGNGNYFYTDWRGRTPWGDTNPDWGQGHVRQMLVENAKMWILDYHLDGFRVDSTVSIRKDNDDGWDWNGGDNPDGWSWLQYFNNEVRPLKNGKVVTIAEDIAGNSWITKNVSEGGAGFNAQWQPSPIVNVVTVSNDDDRDMNQVASAIGETIHTNYGYHEIVKYHSSHDTVDARNDHWRLPNMIGDPFQWYAWKRSKLAMGIILGSPGTPMIFMGDEFYSQGQWDDDPEHSLDWNLLGWNRPFYEYTRNMIRLTTGRKHGSMHTNNLEIPVIDNGMKIISWKRWDNYGDQLVFVANFRSSVQTRSIPFPEDGAWYEIVNSDSAAFGGDNIGNGGSVNVSGGSADVTIGSYSIIVFGKSIDVYPAQQAENPSPWDGQPGVSLNPTLSWSIASDAASYNVMLGTDRTAVENSGSTSPEWRGNQAGATYDVTGLDPLTDYYWRIDTVNAFGDVTKGKVWHFITGDGNSGSNGLAVWFPENPVSGEMITIRFYSELSVIPNSSSMYIHWGINGWKNTVDTPMNSEGVDRWVVTLTLPENSSMLDFAFTNGESWDNNSGRDWHVPVRASSPRAEWTPDQPLLEQQMTIIYHSELGPLAGAEEIYIHLGRNNWEEGTIIHPLMVEGVGGDWTYTFTVPAETDQVDFVFADGPWPDGAGVNWDNNNGVDWHVNVQQGNVPRWGISSDHLQPKTFVGENPPLWSLQIWNDGKGSLDWSVTKEDAGDGTDWFNMSPVSGSSENPTDKDTVNIDFDADQLDPGVYRARINIAETDGELPDRLTSVTLTVREMNHIIVNALTVNIDWPTTGIAQGSFSLRNENMTAMPFQIGIINPEENSWLSVSPTSGTNYGIPSIINLTANPEGLDYETKEADISVTANKADNSPVTIRVRLLAIPSNRNAWYLY